MRIKKMHIVAMVILCGIAPEISQAFSIFSRQSAPESAQQPQQAPAPVIPQPAPRPVPVPQNLIEEARKAIEAMNGAENILQLKELQEAATTKINTIPLTEENDATILELTLRLSEIFDTRTKELKSRMPARPTQRPVKSQPAPRPAQEPIISEFIQRINELKNIQNAQELLRVSQLINTDIGKITNRDDRSQIIAPLINTLEVRFIELFESFQQQLRNLTNEIPTALEDTIKQLTIKGEQIYNEQQAMVKAAQEHPLLKGRWTFVLQNFEINSNYTHREFLTALTQREALTQQKKPLPTERPSLRLFQPQPSLPAQPTTPYLDFIRASAPFFKEGNRLIGAYKNEQSIEKIDAFINAFNKELPSLQKQFLALPAYSSRLREVCSFINYSLTEIKDDLENQAALLKRLNKRMQEWQGKVSSL